MDTADQYADKDGSSQYGGTSHRSRASSRRHSSTQKEIEEGGRRRTDRGRHVGHTTSGSTVATNRSDSAGDRVGRSSSRSGASALTAVCVCGAAGYWERQRIAITRERNKLQDDQEAMRAESKAMNDRRQELMQFEQTAGTREAGLKSREAAAAAMQVELSKERDLIRKHREEMRRKDVSLKEDRLRIDNEVEEVRRNKEKLQKKVDDVKAREIEVEKGRKETLAQWMKIKSAQSDLDESEVRIRTGRTENERREAKMEKHLSYLKEKQKSLYQLQKQLTEKRNALSAKETSVKELEQQSRDRVRQAETLEMTNAAIQLAQEKQQSAVDAQMADLATTAKQLDQRQQQFEDTVREREARIEEKASRVENEISAKQEHVRLVCDRMREEAEDEVAQLAEAAQKEAHSRRSLLDAELRKAREASEEEINKQRGDWGREVERKRGDLDTDMKRQRDLMEEDITRSQSACEKEVERRLIELEEEIERRVSEVDRHAKVREGEMRKAEDMLKERTRDIERRENQLMNEEKRLTSLKAEAERHEIELKETESRLNSLDEFVKSAQKRSQQMSDELAHKEKEIEQNLSSLKVRASAIEEAEVSVRERQQASEKQQRQVAQLEAEVHQREAAVSRKATELTSLEKKLSNRELVLTDKEARDVHIQGMMKDVNDMKEQYEMKRDALEWEQQTFNKMKEDFDNDQIRVSQEQRQKEYSIKSKERDILLREKELKRGERILEQRVNEQGGSLKHKLLTLQPSPRSGFATARGVDNPLRLRRISSVSGIEVTQGGGGTARGADTSSHFLNGRRGARGKAMSDAGSPIHSRDLPSPVNGRKVMSSMGVTTLKRPHSSRGRSSSISHVDSGGVCSPSPPHDQFTPHQASDNHDVETEVSEVSGVSDHLQEKHGGPYTEEDDSSFPSPPPRFGHRHSPKREETFSSEVMYSDFGPVVSEVNYSDAAHSGDNEMNEDGNPSPLPTLVNTGPAYEEFNSTQDYHHERHPFKHTTSLNEHTTPLSEHTTSLNEHTTSLDMGESLEISPFDESSSLSVARIAESLQEVEDEIAKSHRTHQYSNDGTHSRQNKYGDPSDRCANPVRDERVVPRTTSANSGPKVTEGEMRETQVHHLTSLNRQQSGNNIHSLASLGESFLSDFVPAGVEQQNGPGQTSNNESPLLSGQNVWEHRLNEVSMEESFVLSRPDTFCLSSAQSPLNQRLSSNWSEAPPPRDARGQGRLFQSSLARESYPSSPAS